MRYTVTFFNLGILLATILGLNFNSQTVLDQLVTKNYLAESNVIEYNKSAGSGEESNAVNLEEMGISLHPGTDYAPGSKSSPSSLKHCKSLVYRTLKSLPQEPVKRLRNLTLYFNDEGRRGLGGGGTIILRCQNVTDEELVGVLVHEMGHITDTGVINGSAESGYGGYMDGSNQVYKDDPSLDFYDLSFKNEKTLKDDATEYDFVSGYAMSDPFEDFAESYAYYILHGDEFRELVKSNSILQEKYDYLKNRVFNGKEYYNGSGEVVTTTVRQYDVTVLPYDLQKFFVI
jgi:hypothetical protein